MIALAWLRSPVAVVTGMCLFGIGFGISQNATFAVMVDRMPAAGLGTASALWNLAYDGGYGAGPAAFGLLVGHTGYPAAFAGVGAVMMLALPSARHERAARLTNGCSPPPGAGCAPLSCRVEHPETLQNVPELRG